MGWGGAGPEFVAMNGICRSYPPAVVLLLEGDGMTAANKLCTTLFCISSGIKKISQRTAEPKNGCAPLQRGGGWRVDKKGERAAIFREFSLRRPERKAIRSDDRQCGRRRG